MLLFSLSQRGTAGIALACALLSSRAEAQRQLRLTHFDIGQGDATLIVTPNGRRILIDAGSTGGSVAHRLRMAGIDTLHLVIASHHHADHIGGMPEVFASAVVLSYMDNGVPHTTQAYIKTLNAVAGEPGLTYLEATERVVTLDGVVLRVLPPPRANSTQNDNSIGILLEYGAFRALYTGDSEPRELEHWLRDTRIPTVTLMKASHHGSSNGVTSAWITATAPQVVVISVGARNSHGHPSAAILQLWHEAGARVYRTDTDGTIEITASRAGEYTVQKVRP